MSANPTLSGPTMDKKRPKNSSGRRAVPALTTEPTFRRRGSWKPRTSSVLWLKLNFTIKTARLQSLKRQKYQHLQEEALLKARGLLKNWEDGPVVLTEDLYSRARSEHDAQELLNYTPEALALRFSLRNHPDVIDAVKQLWSVELPRDEMGCIDQRGYASLFRRIGRSLEPDASKRRLRRMEKTIQEDWNRDNKGEPVMSFANFFDSVFELADLWCETIDADEYIAFLRRLVLRVSTMRRNKRDPTDEGTRMLRSLKQIKAIDNDEESSSSSDEEEEEVDDEEEIPSAGDSDDSDEEEDNLPVQLPSPVPTIHSVGFIATKALQTLRAKTPPSSAGPLPDTNNTPEDQPRLRERCASIITLGDFSIDGLGGCSGLPGDRDSDKEEELKTPTGLCVSSAKSRTTSAKGRTPLTSVRENGDAANSDDGGVNALVAMHRLQSSAQPRTPVVVEDAAVSSVVPNNKASINVGLPLANIPQQKQQRPGKVFTTAFETLQSGMGIGSVNMDGLPVSGGLRGPLTSSAPQLKTLGGLKSATIGNVDTARVGSGVARRAMLSSSSSKAKQKGEKTIVGMTFDGTSQFQGNNKRRVELGLKTASSSGAAHVAQTLGSHGIKLAEGDTYSNTQSLHQSSSEAPREFVSGLGFDVPATETKEGGMHKKTGVLPANSSLSFYSFDESISPAKRLLPPVLSDSAGRGRSGKARRQGSDDRGGQEPDLTASYKTTGYLTGSLQAHLLAPTQASAASSRSADGRKTTAPLWSKEGRPHTRHSASKQLPKRMRKVPRDDDGTVSPWDTEFDDEHDDDDLARAFPRERHSDDRNFLTTPVATAPVSSSDSAPRQEDLDPELASAEPPTLSVSSSMVPPEPPSCVSELTTLPHEYHELILGGSAINSYKGLSRTVSAPVTFASPTPVTHQVNLLSRDPQWMLHGATQPPLSLLEDGVEGRTVAGSPRPVLAALTSTRPRRKRVVDEDEVSGLCPRFIEHLETHGNRGNTAPSLVFRTDKPRSRCVCHDEVLDKDQEVKCCHLHGSSNNNWQEEEIDEEYIPLEQGVEMNSSQVEDVTVIVNATRGLVLRPGTMDRLAAKRARSKQQATRSEMMRRRSQYTFAKHLD